MIFCTDADPLNPQHISLAANEAYHTDKNPERAMKTVVQLKDLFGPGDTAPLAPGYPNHTLWNMEPVFFFLKRWTFFIAGQPWPPAAFGPIELLVTYYFAFIDPNTRAALPGQEIQSSIMFWLGRSNSCAPSFCSPFQTPSVNFWAYLKK